MVLVVSFESDGQESVFNVCNLELSIIFCLLRNLVTFDNGKNNLYMNCEQILRNIVTTKVPKYVNSVFLNFV